MITFKELATLPLETLLSRTLMGERLEGQVFNPTAQRLFDLQVEAFRDAVKPVLEDMTGFSIEWAEGPCCELPDGWEVLRDYFNNRSRPDPRSRMVIR